MTDGGVGIASLALAVPGVVDLAIKYGEWIIERVDSFQNAKGVWTDLDKFGRSLAGGKLKMDIELAEQIYHSDESAPELKKSLEDQIERLDEELKKAEKLLLNMDVTSIPSRAMFAISGERQAKKINKALRAHQQDLSELLILNDIKKRQVPDNLLLSPSRFKDDKRRGYHQVPSTPNIFVAEGSYKIKETDSQSRELDVIIEEHEGDESSSEASLRGIASLLYYRFAEDSPKIGILRCLGYRMDPTPELIFELPENLHNPQTLQTLIAADVGKRFGGNQPLDYRFKLARQLSESVLRVHSVNLVHKSIRSANILVLQPDVDSKNEAAKHAVGFGEPFLMNWSLLREATSLSSMWGTSKWAENIYRHPNRQGIQVEERYNLGHDVYSLGVCLLEIGLWEPLVHTRTADGNPRVSDLFRAAAKVETAPDPEAELQSKLGRPLEMKRILTEMARHELPARMGLSYMRLVVACLTALDAPSGFGSEVDFRNFNQTERGVAFKELVLGYFTDRTI